MRLSEAILLGCYERKQSVYFDGCALGSAAKAMGCFDIIPLKFLRATWPWLNQQVTSPDPSTRDYEVNSVETVMEDLNGYARTGLRWSRERIAAWIASIEPAEAAPVSVEVAQEEVGA
jgi:hypothetical protein